MKKAVLLVLLGMLFAVLTVAPSYAQKKGMSIQEKIEDQQHRINEGRRTGALTHQEAEVVQDNLDHVKNRRAGMKSDGDLSKPERKRLHELLDENSELIYKKKHNFRRLY